MTLFGIWLIFVIYLSEQVSHDIKLDSTFVFELDFYLMWYEHVIKDCKCASQSNFSSYSSSTVLIYRINTWHLQITSAFSLNIGLQAKLFETPYKSKLHVFPSGQAGWFNFENQMY